MTTTDTGPQPDPTPVAGAPQTARSRMHRNIERLNSDGAVKQYLRFRFRQDVLAVEAEAARGVTTTPTCQHDDAGQPCGRHLERGECSVHGRAAWPNPDACCSRNAFEDDAHAPTCPNASDYTRAFQGRAASPAALTIEVERPLDAWDAGYAEGQAASPAALDALERAVIDAAIRVHDSQQASGSTLAPGERGIGGQMMTAWIRAEPFEELLDATYALLRERDRARLAHPEESGAVSEPRTGHCLDCGRPLNMDPEVYNPDGYCGTCSTIEAAASPGERCPVEGCDELPEDHRHISNVDQIIEKARIVSQWHGAIGSGPIEELDAELGELYALTHLGGES